MPVPTFSTFLKQREAEKAKNQEQNKPTAIPKMSAGEVPSTASMSAGSGDTERTRQADSEMVTPEEKEAVVTGSRDIAEAETKDKWGKEAAEKALRHYGTNLAKENPYGNLNGMSFRNTRNLSRLADAVNNRLHKGPQKVGNRGSEAVIAEPHQWDKIETQEMRQMRADEQVDMAMRQGMVQQQQSVNMYEMQLQQKLDDLSIQLSQALGINELQIQSAARQAVINANYTLPVQQRMQLIGARFIQKLANETKSEAVKWAYDIWQQNPAVGAFAMQATTGGMLGFDEYMQAQIWNAVRTDPKNVGKSQAEMYQAFLAVTTAQTLARYTQTMDLVKGTVDMVNPFK